MMLNPIKVIEVNTSNQVTVLQAVGRTHMIETGFVCSSPKDIVGIDGVKNSEDKYWTIEVNGDYEHFNSMSLVGPKDRVVLKYGVSKEK